MKDRESDNDTTDPEETERGGVPGNTKHISPKDPGDLWTCTSFLSRELVAQYLKLGMLNGMDAVAMHISSGVVEFGRLKLRFFDSEATIARELGLSEETVRVYAGRLIAKGLLARAGKNGDCLKERWWSIPALKFPYEGDPGSVTDSCGDGVPGHGETATPGYGDRNKQSRVTATHSYGATATHGCGHLKESGSEGKKDEENKVGKEKNPDTCLPFSRSLSLLKTSMGSVDGSSFDLTRPEGFVSCWDSLLDLHTAKRSAGGRDKGSAPDPMDIRRAYKTLKQMADLKTQETVWAWLVWYVEDGGLAWSPWITEFSKTWDGFRPKAEEMLAEVRRLEAEQRAVERQAEAERQEARRLAVEREIREREEAQRLAAEEMAKERAAKRKRARDEFLARLPTPEAIRQAVEGVSPPEPLDDDSYYNWLQAMMEAVPRLGMKMEYKTCLWTLIELMRESLDNQTEEVASKARDFVVHMAEGLLKQIWANPDVVEFRGIQIDWRAYAEFFGIDKNGTPRQWQVASVGVAKTMEPELESPFDDIAEE